MLTLLTGPVVFPYVVAVALAAIWGLAALAGRWRRWPAIIVVAVLVGLTFIRVDAGLVALSAGLLLAADTLGRGWAQFPPARRPLAAGASGALLVLGGVGLVVLVRAGGTGWAACIGVGTAVYGGWRAFRNTLEARRAG